MTDKKYIINQAIEHAKDKVGLKWDNNRQRLSFYEYVNEYINEHYISLEDKLDGFKKEGYYAVNLFFGEDIGCDDLDNPLYERNITLIAAPVGCLGETRIMFKGTLGDFLTGKTEKPKVISNPPMKSSYSEGGWYIWGTPEGVNTIMKRNFKETL